MRPDKDFPIPEKMVVPAQLRANLNSLMRSTTKIVVNEKHEDGKLTKINGLKLNCQPGQLPVEGLDEIAEAVTAIMWNHWSEQETEDPHVGLPPVEFVISCEFYDSNKKRIRQQFSHVYKGDSEVDVMEEIVSVEQRAVDRAMSLLERQNNQLLGHNDLLHNMILKFFGMQNDAAQANGTASTESMKHAIPMFFGGIQAMLNARMMEYNSAKAEASERATTDRIIGGLKTLGPFLGMGLTQFIAHKLGIDPMQLGAMFGGGGGPPGAPPHGPNGAPPPEADPDGEEPIVERLAAFANLLGDELTNAQRRELGRRFDPTQVAALDDLFCAQTDREVLAAYQVVVGVIGPKLLELRELLSSEQQQSLAAFTQEIRQYAQAAAAAPPTA
jgi:hypothetical protein